MDGFELLERLAKRVRILEVRNPLENAAVDRGGLFIRSNEGLVVEGSAKVAGWLIVTGTERVTGLLEVLGTLRAEGAIDLIGPTSIAGDMDVEGAWRLIGNGEITGNFTTTGDTVLGGMVRITGATTIEGAVELDSDLTLGTGRILVGPISIDRLGDYGGRIASGAFLQIVAGSLLRVDTPMLLASGGIQSIGNIAAGGNLSAAGNVVAEGAIIGSSKSFSISHPSKPGKRLVHGSLEGPEHGVYYRGRVTFDEDGEATYSLPDYYQPLVGDETPTVIVTPIGRPFSVGAEEPDDGQVTVYGEHGRSAHVVVIGAREQFEVEPDAQAS